MVTYGTDPETFHGVSGFKLSIICSPSAGVTELVVYCHDNEIGLMEVEYKVHDHIIALPKVHGHTHVTRLYLLPVYANFQSKH